ncbi:hypothetical protein [Tolypothrix sp. VBCCA 56010]|uniref:hypothetical protein n=1 Tax=Tolypothrix sp. VBCCA 56010 TaxID=3137731 RepID=UPI003D7E3BD3
MRRGGEGERGGWGDGGMGGQEEYYSKILLVSLSPCLLVPPTPHSPVYRPSFSPRLNCS